MYNVLISFEGIILKKLQMNTLPSIGHSIKLTPEMVELYKKNRVGWEKEEIYYTDRFITEIHWDLENEKIWLLLGEKPVLPIHSSNHKTKHAYHGGGNDSFMDGLAMGAIF